MARALVICGPTSSGKSEVALGVAQQLGGEIVNADSRQIYAGMEIGTGVPGPDALRAVPHHLYGFVAPGERYSAARYLADASAVIAGIEGRGRVAVVVGGTGFYIETLLGTMTLDRPPGDDELRDRLRAEARTHPPRFLWEWLAVLSPQRGAATGSTDSYRSLRALEGELARRARATPSPRGPGTEVAPAPPARLESLVAVLEVERTVLRERIARRVGDMFASGLVHEAQAVRAETPHAPALSGLGYAEALALYDGTATQDEARAMTIRRTERYAKRQQTWFRRMRDAVRIDARRQDAATSAILAKARETWATAGTKTGPP